MTKIRGILRTVWHGRDITRCAECGAALAGPSLRFDGTNFCSEECAGLWQCAEVAP